MRSKLFKLVAITLFFTISKTYSQESKISEITDNLDELFINKDNPLNEIPKEALELYYEDIPKIYYFDIVYNDKLIFREVIEKSVPQSASMEIVTNQFRFKYKNIYLDASLITDSDKLKLLESYSNRIIDVAGIKMINLKDFEILKNDYKKKRYVVNNPLDNMKIKIYKISFE